MKIQVYVEDKSKVAKMLEMGIECEPEYHLTDFWFKDCMLNSAWVDKSHDAHEIVCGIDGGEYRTPFNERLLKKMLNIIEPTDNQ